LEAWAKKRFFSVKSTYALACNSQYALEIKLFKLIHKWCGPKRIRSSLWKLANESILTNAKRLSVRQMASIILRRNELIFTNKLLTPF